jgi:hypothetical protein
VGFVFSFIFFQDFLPVSIFSLDKMAILADNGLDKEFVEDLILSLENPKKGEMRRFCLQNCKGILYCGRSI